LKQYSLTRYREQPNNIAYKSKTADSLTLYVAERTAVRISQKEEKRDDSEKDTRMPKEKKQFKLLLSIC